MSVVLTALGLMFVAPLAVQLFASWRARRDDRRERLLRESWAIYRASRAIHDETLTALQAMLDTARSKSGDGR